MSLTCGLITVEATPGKEPGKEMARMLFVSFQMEFGPNRTSAAHRGVLKLAWLRYVLVPGMHACTLLS